MKKLFCAVIMFFNFAAFAQGVDVNGVWVPEKNPNNQIYIFSQDGGKIYFMGFYYNGKKRIVWHGPGSIVENKIKVTFHHTGEVDDQPDGYMVLTVSSDSSVITGNYYVNNNPGPELKFIRKN